MKKIIGIIFISLMFSNIGFAEITLIEEKIFEGKGVVSTFCVDRYKFVTFGATTDNDGVSIVQFFRQSPSRYGVFTAEEC